VKDSNAELVKIDAFFVPPYRSFFGWPLQKNQQNHFILCEQQDSILFGGTRRGGQSETAGSWNGGFLFAVLKLAGAGDELQGIKGASWNWPIA